MERDLEFQYNYKEEKITAPPPVLDAIKMTA